MKNDESTGNVTLSKTARFTIQVEKIPLKYHHIPIISNSKCKVNLDTAEKE